MTVTASAPGSTMITGEHAVVCGHPAIVAAVDQRITVTVETTGEATLTVASDIADPASYPIDALPADGPYRFICAAVAQYWSTLQGGLAITVTSDINPTLGLGSSAAVTIATLGALDHLTGRGADIHATALGIVRSIQGRGSGADLAASLHGGVVSYQLAAEAAVAIPLPQPPAISLRYTGYKTPTGEVLERVAKAWEGRETALDAIYAQMGADATQTIAAFTAEDWAEAGRLMTRYQDLMVELGVSDATIDGIIAEASGALGLKISGSGLGDCVLALGAVPDGFNPAPIAPEGLIIHD